MQIAEDEKIFSETPNVFIGFREDLLVKGSTIKDELLRRKIFVGKLKSEGADKNEFLKRAKKAKIRNFAVITDGYVGIFTSVESVSDFFVYLALCVLQKNKYLLARYYRLLQVKSRLADNFEVICPLVSDRQKTQMKFNANSLGMSLSKYILKMTENGKIITIDSKSLARELYELNCKLNKLERYPAVRLQELRNVINMEIYCINELLKSGDKCVHTEIWA